MTIGDIQQKIYTLTKSSSSDFTNAEMLVAINNAYERVTSLILQSDGRWQFDDSNRSDFPIATANLVSAQNDYELAVAHLRIARVELKNSEGNWYQLQPMDPKDFEGESITELSEESGAPKYYDKLGASIVLYPTPNYSSTNGLKIYYQRGPELFSASDLTTGEAVPGFNSLYHSLLALWPSYEYASANVMRNAGALMQDINRLEDQLKKDYARRDKDERHQITFKRISHI
jgi:hypothetical protein